MKKILVVDDDPGILDVVKYILTSNGFLVQTHDSGYDVPDIILHYRPDLILLDIRLPGKLGTEICRELKKLNKIPIILFSAHADYHTALAECAADDFIQKPFELDDFLQTIRSHLN